MSSLPSNLLIIVLTSVVSLCDSQDTGTDHLLNESPWFITLYVTCPSMGAIKTCGGSLINDKWILTTATCVKCEDSNIIPMVVADVGSATGNVQDLFQSEAAEVGRYVVNKIVIHNKSKNNIALLHLQHPVVSNSRHKMMQLSKCYQVDNAMNTNSIELLSHSVNTDKFNDGSSLGDKMKVLKRKKCNAMSTTCKSSKSAGTGDFCATFIESQNLSCNYDEGMTLGIHSGDDWIMTGFVNEKPKDCSSCPLWFMDVCKYYEWVINIISSASSTQGNYKMNYYMLLQQVQMYTGTICDVTDM